MSKQLKLGAFLFAPGNHAGGWRHPHARPETDMDFAAYAHLAQTAERGRFDTLFFQDSAAVPADTLADGGRTGFARATYLEPLSLIAALAPLTRHIGLIATVTTSYNEPYHVARRIASIDHISGGRAGWNLVTSQIEDEAGNFGLDAHLRHAQRYARAEEFHDVVRGLWDSWQDDALERDKQGRYFDPAKVHRLDHQGQHFRVRGPLNVARAPQGHPIVSQAGASEAGRELAARTADLVFTAALTLEEAQAFYRDVKQRARRHGRDPDHIKILPGLLPIVGRSEEEARAKHQRLLDLLPDDLGIKPIARLAGDLDLTQYPLDGPLPELPPNNSAHGRQQLLVDLARRENLTIRQLARHFACAGGHQVVYGTPQTIADHMQAWLENEGADGFIIQFPFFPAPLEEFVEQVVPELQRRGIYRTQYEGATLRDSLGLPRPAHPAEVAR
ncbi:nitrilotriacetate monooxygenase [Stutzerimonas kirkiae]|uniref:Nitrilotriacetate monooxygenase n=1 Tax=Stutzerimonas kirkiae TaxID=2211392 RepID=A0A4Q9QWW3_9GAMM|nr:LLM class flavin-dependent oxidoreductase [Stutzerimonas kirkiae]TBU88678.1 nitrilotriacetate monooxygenase [Stutzerimonas kirkiae]TBU98502.1 nitrilotriacetate monooxygenase [Stutzerimonas kirkiae]